MDHLTFGAVEQNSKLDRAKIATQVTMTLSNLTRLGLWLDKIVSDKVPSNLSYIKLSPVT